MKSENQYAELIWKLLYSIFRCPCLKPDHSPSCLKDANSADFSGWIGPEGIFVGKNYGMEDLPKILFMGFRSKAARYDFGTMESLSGGFEYPIRLISSQVYQNCFYSGIPNRGFYGYKDFPIYNNRHWSISEIITRLFPDKPELLEGFASTNAILCNQEAVDECSYENRPNNEPVLLKNCLLNREWLRKTIEILEPEIIFIYSIKPAPISLWDEFSVENGVVDDKEYLNPERSVGYYAIFNKKFTSEGKKSFKSLTFGIPHLRSPEFETWVWGIPHRFRDIFPLSRKEIISAILKNIGEIISNELNFKNRQEQIKDEYRRFWDLLYNRYRKLDLKNLKLSSISPATYSREKNLGVSKKLNFYFYVKGIKEKFSENSIKNPHIELGINLYSNIRDWAILKKIYSEFSKIFESFNKSMEANENLRSVIENIEIRGDFEKEDDKAFYMAYKYVKGDFDKISSSTELQMKFFDGILIYIDNLLPLLREFANDRVKNLEI